MMIKLIVLLFAFLPLFTSCGTENSAEVAESSVEASVTESVAVENSAIVNTGKSADEAYEMLHVVFEGNPNEESIKKLMGAVMVKYNVEENFENLNRCGSALLSMRESSAIGITEMEILKHMYQEGDVSQTFPNQVAISAVRLEQTK